MCGIRCDVHGVGADCEAAQDGEHRDEQGGAAAEDVLDHQVLGGLGADGEAD